MFCILNILFYHPVSEATPNSKITGAYCTVYLFIIISLLKKYSSRDTILFKVTSVKVQHGVHIISDEFDHLTA